MSNTSRVGVDLYFIYNPQLDLMKIGSAKNVEARRRDLETTIGVPLKTMRVFAGMSEHERLLHFTFSESRRLGEWFRPTGDMWAIVNSPEEIEKILGTCNETATHNSADQLVAVVDMGNAYD
jgi:hypothetical protein